MPNLCLSFFFFAGEPQKRERFPVGFPLNQPQTIVPLVPRSSGSSRAMTARSTPWLSAPRRHAGDACHPKPSGGSQVRQSARPNSLRSALSRPNTLSAGGGLAERLPRQDGEGCQTQVIPLQPFCPLPSRKRNGTKQQTFFLPSESCFFCPNRLRFG